MPFLSISWSQLEIVVVVAVAMAFGAIIGFERELLDKPAGLRTHMLVAGAAAFFVSLGNTLVERHRVVLGESVIQADPIRIIEAVITGISFLGAGTIIRERREGNVTGLTTAASILMAGALGVGVATRLWLPTIGVLLLVLGVLRLMRVIEQKLSLND